MVLLDASLALALTLGALGSVVTMLIEVLFRFTSMRARFLRIMMEKHVLPEILKIPAVAAAVAGLEGQTIDLNNDEEKQKLVKKIVKSVIGNPQKAGDDEDSVAPGKAFERVTLSHFLMKLAEETGLSEKVAEAQTDARKALLRAGRIFDEFAASTGVLFARWARTISLVVGVLLAFTANIDALRLFETYRDNPSTAEVIIANQEALTSQSEAVEASAQSIVALNGEISDLRAKIAADPDGADTAALQQTLQEKEAALAELADPKKIEKLLTDSAATLTSLQSQDLPIGWQHYPAQKFDDTREFFSFLASGEGLSWFARVFVTGLFIGLGGPFWFGLAQRLAAVRNTLRGNASATPTGAGEGNNAAPFDSLKSTVDDVVRSFQESIGATPVADAQAAGPTGNGQVPQG